MMLGELVQRLERLNPDRIILVGVEDAHTRDEEYRTVGFYPAGPMPARDMLANVKEAYQEYLGRSEDKGDKVGDNCHCYLAGEMRGCPDEELTLALLAAMVGELRPLIFGEQRGN